MRNRNINRGLFVVGWLSMIVLAGSAMAKDKPGKKGANPKPKAVEIPAAVTKTLQREARGAQIATAEIEKTKEGGKVVFVAPVKIDGKDYEVRVANDGSLIEKSLDEDTDVQEVKLSACPAAVQKTFKREADGAKIDETVDKELENGKPVYTVVVKIEGKSYEIRVAEAGHLVSKAIYEEEEGS